MKVFVVWYNPGFDSLEILGVYSSKEKAETAYNSWLDKQDKDYEFAYLLASDVEEIEVDL